MKIRSLEELESCLHRDLGWRKHEITNLNTLVSTSKNKTKIMLVRAGITLFYAHWEGHVKKACQLYLQYIIFLGHKNCQLKPNFSHLSIGKEFSKDFHIGSYDSQKRIYDHVLNCGESKFLVDPERIADTKQNLKSEVLFELLKKLGLESDFFETRQHSIDTQLLKYRNLIAHGERVDDKDILSAYDGLKDHVMDMIESFHRMIITAAANQEYLTK